MSQAILRRRDRKRTSKAEQAAKLAAHNKFFVDHQARMDQMYKVATAAWKAERRERILARGGPHAERVRRGP